MSTGITVFTPSVADSNNGPSPDTQAGAGRFATHQPVATSIALDSNIGSQLETVESVFPEVEEPYTLMDQIRSTPALQAAIAALIDGAEDDINVQDDDLASRCESS